MGRYVTFGALAIAVIAIVASLYLYRELHTARLQEPATAVVATNVQSSTTSSIDASMEEEKEKAAKRQAEALDIIRRSADLFLTGDENGRAEWAAPDGDTMPTLCGVTPKGRYFITRNEIGQTRHDEPDSRGGDFLKVWSAIGCEKTAPIRQRAILEAKAKEDLYNLTHPYNPDCVMADFRALAANDPVARERIQSDPHYCQDGQYEREIQKTSSAEAQRGSGRAQ